MTTRRWLWALLLVLLCGFGLRAGRLLEERRGPLAQVPVGDEGTYDRWGVELASGEAEARVPYQAPLQAYHLALWHSLLPARAARDGARAVGVLLGLGTILLTFLLGREVGGARVGVLAAALVATHRPLIYYEPTLLRDGAATFMTTGAVWLLVRWRDLSPGRALALGALMGLGALMRENLVLIALLVVVVTGALAAWGRDPRRLGAAACLFVGLLVPLAPWIEANRRLEGSLHLLPTWNGGNVFYVYNRADNHGPGYAPPPFVSSGNPEAQQDGFRAEAERRLGRSLTPHQISSYWLGQGLRDMAREPGLYARKVLIRSALFLGGGEGAQARDLGLDRQESWVLSLPLPAFGPLAWLALLGLWAALRRPGASRTLGLLALALAGSIVAVGFVDRYRIPVVPAMAVLAVLGGRACGRGLALRERLERPRELSSWAVDLSRRGWGRASVLGGGLAVGLGLLLTPGEARRIRAQGHDAGRLDRAIAWFYLRRYESVEQEVGAMQRPLPVALELLGESRLRAGRAAESAAAYRRAVEQEPGRVKAWAGLALALSAAGERDRALEAIREARRLDDRPAFAELERRLSE